MTILSGGLVIFQCSGAGFSAVFNQLILGPGDDGVRTSPGKDGGCHF